MVAVLPTWPLAEVEKVVPPSWGWGFHQLSMRPPGWDSNGGLGISQEAGQPDLQRPLKVDGGRQAANEFTMWRRHISRKVVS